MERPELAPVNSAFNSSQERWTQCQEGASLSPGDPRVSIFLS